MATVVSIINLKGGVGKTTLTMALADFLAGEFGKRVLVIDLDPQTSASVALIGQAKWQEKHLNSQTLLQLFKDLQNKSDKFCLENAVVQGASNIKNVKNNLDLLPSSFGFIAFQQDHLPELKNKERILKKAIGAQISHYDIVLVDCPPNLDTLTLNGIYLSEYYLIPVIPDLLSTLGIPQIKRRIETLQQRNSDLKIKPLGVVVNMYRANTAHHNEMWHELSRQSNKRDIPYLFDDKIPLSVDLAEAAKFEETYSSVRQKYGAKNYAPLFSIANELLNRTQRYR